MTSGNLNSDAGDTGSAPTVRDCLDQAGYFVILAAMRTGSNLLQSNLNQYRDIVCLGELFNRRFVGVNMSGKSAKPVAGYARDDVAKRNRDEPLFFDRVYAAFPEKIFGFRMFAGQNDRLLARVLQNRNCRKVILRRNALDSFISLQIAARSDRWMSRNPDNIQQLQVRFSMKKFLGYVEEVERFYAQCKAALDDSGQVVFEIRYEQLKDVAVLNRLAKFLGSGVEKNRLKEKIYKQTLPGLEQKVVNYEAMVQSLRDAGLYHRYIDT